jgi:hypothetical protein
MAAGYNKISPVWGPPHTNIEVVVGKVVRLMQSAIGRHLLASIQGYQHCEAVIRLLLSLLLCLFSGFSLFSQFSIAYQGFPYDINCNSWACAGGRQTLVMPKVLPPCTHTPLPLSPRYAGRLLGGIREVSRQVQSGGGTFTKDQRSSQRSEKEQPVKTDRHCQ